MKKIAFYSALTLIVCSCKGQLQIKGRYEGNVYKETLNDSFINSELRFINGSDTVKLNLKLPFDRDKRQVNDRGIFYNCHLKKDTVYSITLKTICAADIVDVPVCYYKINTIPDVKECFRFTEVAKTTEYRDIGNYGKYVDMGGVLYEIVRLSPNSSCYFQH
ncbi:hypothetical protein Q4E93_21980 [Flavitalea sp. BT771]|uniref:hypothetical protein n=1 Tax=Flavitalea sp. BT771 TaxID=3063329 RepID=UPI0026E176A9|nr:hypothetical protein [Flavitalea sp. BT771]MDO6433296.1 hypothetical protein [Flavitalea sp. BT771]MDV6222799.1 hypothetical protein [Flavitalea sp. BT771]